MFKPKVLAAATAAAATMLGSAGLARADLVGRWVGDNYNGGNWNDTAGADDVGTAVSDPARVDNAFNGHAGVEFDGDDYFTVANNVVGATGLTLAAAFKPTAPGASSGGQFWQNAGLIGNEQGGAVNDWGLGFGASQAKAGVGAPDTTVTSGDLSLNAPHVAVMTWNTTGQLTLYVDGVQVAQQATTATAARDAAAFASYALGANLSVANGDLKPFVGQIAELRVYNDTNVDPLSVSAVLERTYGIPEPGSLALLGIGASALLARRRRPRT